MHRNKPWRVAALGLWALAAGTAAEAGWWHRDRPAEPGFGLKFKLGYGYGGNRYGVGPNGGYPNYGGPGYPHPGPPLNRFGKIAPEFYNGGAGYPRVGYGPYFQGVGPLAVNPPIVETGDGTESPGTADYGDFTGAIPYPENRFAPYASPSLPTGRVP